MVFSGSANEELAAEVAKLLDIELGGVERSKFANGEIYVRYTESVRGADCFVIQSHSDPVNFHIMEQLIFYGYARQDKKAQPREPISAKMMGDLFLAAGADRIAAVDLHTGQIQGFTDAPFDSLTAMPLFEEYLVDKLDGPITFVSPDSGGVKRATRFASHIDAEVAFVYKRRRSDVRNEVNAEWVVGRNEVNAEWVVGDVEGRHCVIVDDMIDTAGTAVASAELVLKRGALSVMVLATHGILSPPAVERLAGAPFSEIIITNTLPVTAEALTLPNLTVLSIAPVVAGTIEAIFNDLSVSELFKGENT